MIDISFVIIDITDDSMTVFVSDRWPFFFPTMLKIRHGRFDGRHVMSFDATVLK